VSIHTCGYLLPRAENLLENETEHTAPRLAHTVIAARRHSFLQDQEVPKGIQCDLSCERGEEAPLLL
jgi:hypothetical protein